MSAFLFDSCVFSSIVYIYICICLPIFADMYIYIYITFVSVRFQLHVYGLQTFGEGVLHLCKFAQTVCLCLVTRFKKTLGNKGFLRPRYEVKDVPLIPHWFFLSLNTIDPRVTWKMFTSKLVALFVLVGPIRECSCKPNVCLWFLFLDKPNFMPSWHFGFKRVLSGIAHIVLFTPPNVVYLTPRFSQPLFGLWGHA